MNILVLCTGNSCRSQIAEGFLRKYLPAKYHVYSAGIEKHGLNPNAVKVMAEVGIDISGHTSKTIDELPAKDFDVVLTVCDNAYEKCPFFPGKTWKVHQSFTDPSNYKGSEEEKRESYHVCRDAIGLFCEDLAKRIQAL